MRLISILKFIFFGNYFYGLCAVALSIEAALQQQYPLNGVSYYVVIFASTTWYYTKAYITERNRLTVNQRTNWYIKNRLFVKVSQAVMLLTCIVTAFFFLQKHLQELLQLTLAQWFMILIFPVAATLYYGVNHRVFGRYNIRRIGWLKPFVIGFTWAGLTTVYPIIYYKFVHHLDGALTPVGWFLFVKNFMFVTVLCIMFDIKDYATDYNHDLKTFVVKNGLRKTIFYIIFPLSVAGLGSFLLYALARDFSFMKILLNTIPFLLMLILAYSLQKRKSILYYLGLVDGLMLVKAVCGTLATIYF